MSKLRLELEKVAGANYFSFTTNFEDDRLAGAWPQPGTPSNFEDLAFKAAELAVGLVNTKISFAIGALEFVYSLVKRSEIPKSNGGLYSEWAIDGASDAGYFARWMVTADPNHLIEYSVKVYYTPWDSVNVK